MLIAALLALTSSPAALPTGEDDPTRFQLTDVFELEYASDPQIAPDGSRVVYVRNFMDAMQDRRRSNLWVVDVETRDHRPLTTGDDRVSSPRWSPDGTRLAYVTTASGSSQIHVRWMDTGQEAQLTHLTKSPAGLSWSPDGDQLAFTMLVEEAQAPFVKPPKKPKGATWADPPKVITSLLYRADGSGYLTSGNRQLFLLPADGGTPRQITRGPHDIGGTFSWTPGGETIVVSSNRREDREQEPNDSELYEVTLADGSLEGLTERYGPDQNPAVSPDGQWIAYTGFDDELQGYQVRRLYVLRRSTGTVTEVLPDLDRSVRAPRWGEDGRVYYLYDDLGDTKLSSVKPMIFPASDYDGNKVEHVMIQDAFPWTGGVGGESIGRPYAGGGYSVARTGRVAYTFTSPERPADIAVLDASTGEDDQRPQVLTRLNEDLFGHKTLGHVEELWAKSSADRRRVQGWLVHPPGFDPSQTYPLILEIHGGPFANYGPRFTAECQLYAAAGYVVLYVNPRGSTSYGETFGNLIHHAYPGQDYDDLMSAVDATIARGYVDADRLFVTGGSGGGVLTAWIVGKTNRFRAAVVAKPVIHWTSFVLTSDLYNVFTKYWFPGFPWDHQDHYWKRSPLSLVGNVSTPTMVLTGEADYRTPMSESEQYYQALKLRGIDAALVRVPDASHGIAARPSHLIAKVAHILTWFEDHASDNRANASSDAENEREALAYEPDTPREAVIEFNRALGDRDRERARSWTLSGEAQTEFFDVTYTVSEQIALFKRRFIEVYGEDKLTLIQNAPGAQLDYLETHADDERLESMVIDAYDDEAFVTFSDGVRMRVAREGDGWKVDSIGMDSYDEEDLDRIRAALGPSMILGRILEEATEEIDPRTDVEEFDERLGRFIANAFDRLQDLAEEER